MRKQPFTLSSETSSTATPVETTAMQAPEAKPLSLAERLAAAPVLNNPIAEEQTETTSPDPKEEKNNPDAVPPVLEPEEITSEFNQGFQDFKENVVKKKLKDFAIKPEKLSAFLVRAGNGLRVFFLPWVYGKIAGLSEEEMKDALLAKKKRNDAEKENKEPDLTKYETRILGYLEKLEEANLSISYQEEEIQEFAKILSARIADVDIPEWMEKYDWLLFILYLEWIRVDKLVYSRIGKSVQSKFG